MNDTVDMKIKFRNIHRQFPLANYVIIAQYMSIIQLIFYSRFLSIQFSFVCCH